MASVALIGPDGAGKTTLTRMLEASGVAPLKYLYMGIDIPASNVALPTSRLIQQWRARARRRGHGHDASVRMAAAPRRRVTLRALARLTNEFAEQWSRQVVSWYYQRAGFIVLYDRHFVFDFAPEIRGDRAEPLDRRIHRHLLRFYPRPDLVLFLDAPGTVLYARKAEWTIEELERRRQAFLRIGDRTPGFVRIDATRPLDEVCAEVSRHVVQLAGRHLPSGSGEEEP